MQASAIGNTSRSRSLSSHAPTILLVEDDAPVRELVARILKADGYAVLKARHSAEALYFNGEFTGAIHLLLTDLCMTPHMNGRKLAEAVRVARPGIPVLYISGFVDDDGVAEDVGAGTAHFLPKPFSPGSLLQAVRTATARLAEFRAS